MVLASIGRVQPITLAIKTAITSVRQTTSATTAFISAFPKSSPSINMTLAKLTIASAAPHRIDTLISFHMTLAMSLSSMFPSDRPRIMVADACPPALPPVSMSIGMNAVRTTLAASFSSKPVIIIPVNVAETMSKRSHGMRLRKVSITPVLK